MKTNTHYTTGAGTVYVRFISCYQGVADYGIVLCCSGKPEARVSVSPDGEVMPPNFADHFVKEYGFTFEAASNAVRAFMAEKFDADVKEIVRMGILEHADKRAQKRAVELGLIAEVSA